MYIYIYAACLPLSNDSFPASLLHPNSSPLICFYPILGIRGSSLGSGSEPSLRTASQNMLTICYQIRCKGELVKCWSAECCTHAQRCQGNILSIIPFTNQTLIRDSNALHTSKNSLQGLCPMKGVGHRDAHFRLEFAQSAL